MLDGELDGRDHPFNANIQRQQTFLVVESLIFCSVAVHIANICKIGPKHTVDCSS